LNREFAEEKIQMANKHPNKCSISLATKEKQIKITLKFHLTPVSLAMIKEETKTNAGENVRRKESSYTVGGNVNWCNHYRNQYGGFSKH
jgi:hypothetical protein